MFWFEGSTTISILSAKALGIRRGSKPLRTDGSDDGSPNTLPAAELLDLVLGDDAACTTCALQLLVWLDTVHCKGYIIENPHPTAVRSSDAGGW